jgi:hypothetical protein
MTTKLAPMAQDVRWKQRFQNYDRASVLLRQALERGPKVLSPLENEGGFSVLSILSSWREKR